MAASSSRILAATNPGDDKLKHGSEDGQAPAASAEDLRLLVIERLSISSPSGQDKKLLILDINGILAHTFYPNDDGVRVPRSRSPDAVTRRKYVFKRPFCEEFLTFCFKNFHVAIWSSATRRNVEGAIKCILGLFADRLLFIWDQTKCTKTGFNTLENKHKPLFMKELRRVWESDVDHANLQGGHRRSFSPSNTLLIDDSPYKALLNPTNTAIFPEPYKVDDVDDASLGLRGELRSFLEGLAASDEEVPSYVGSHPLGQRPITAAHPAWDFYSRIVGRKESTHQPDLVYPHVRDN